MATYDEAALRAPSRRMRGDRGIRTADRTAGVDRGGRLEGARRDYRWGVDRDGRGEHDSAIDGRGLPRVPARPRAPARTPARLPPSRRVLGQAAHDHRVDLRLRAWTRACSARRRHPVDLRVQDLEHAALVEREGAGQHLVCHHRQRVAVGGGPDLVAGHLLRRHVRGRAGGDAGQRLDRRRLHQLGEAEVGQDRRVVSAPSSTLAGLTSRCTMPRECA